MSEPFRRTFNFRHVLDRLGIAPSNEVDWTSGQLIRKLAAEYGIEPERVLTDKTDPEPSVAAQHCIAHYPMAMFEPAVERVGRWWGERSRQMGFDL